VPLEAASSQPDSAALPPVAAARALVAQELCKRYDDRPVLQSVSLTVAHGERLALTGPSGSGKTTLLNCLGGVDRPDTGTIALLGLRLDQLDDDGLARVRRRHLGTVFQFFHLLPTLTAAENVELPLQLLGVPARERRDRVRHWLDRVRVAHRGDARPEQLSGGEMQRVAIARALVHQPGVVLADEPTGNLDSVNGRHVLDLLAALTDETRTALVLVTHSAEAAAICHRVLHLQDGRIVSVA
jgi:putative ABC transport system ATP-binding protein